MKWIIKSLFQKTISDLPYRKNINYFFQKDICKSLPLNNNKFMEVGKEGVLHYKAFKKHYINSNDYEAIFCKFGAGLDFTIPIIIYSLGIKKTDNR